MIITGANRYKVLSPELIGGDIRDVSFETRDEMGSAASGVGILKLTPSSAKTIAASISFYGVAVARIEYTMANVDEIENDSPDVEWKPWPKGDISAYDDDYIYSVTALRLFKVSGAGRVIMRLRAQ